MRCVARTVGIAREPLCLLQCREERSELELEGSLRCSGGRYRLSKRSIQRLLGELFGLNIGLGSVCTQERNISEALAPAVQELREHLHNEEALRVNIDETRFRQHSRTSWLWMAATKDFALFKLSFSRARQVATWMLGSDCGVFITSDRYAVYDAWSDEQRQVCWAHLVRDFRRIASRPGAAAEVGEGLLSIAEELFALWHRFKRGELRRSSLRVYLSSLRLRTRRCLERGVLCPGRTGRTCRLLLEHFSALWSFARLEGVEPTNNHAEQQLRHAVLWRKQSYGTHSEAGSRYVERILSVVHSLALQGRALWEYLSHAAVAVLQGHHAASLLPAPALAPSSAQP